MQSGEGFHVSPVATEENFRQNHIRLWIQCSLCLYRHFLSGVTVAVGEFDRRVDDEDEQVHSVKSVLVHEKYHHATPMSYDIALVELHQHIQMGRFTF